MSQLFPQDDLQDAEDALLSETDTAEDATVAEQKAHSDIFNPLSTLYQCFVGKQYNPYKINLSDSIQHTGHG